MVQVVLACSVQGMDLTGVNPVLTDMILDFRKNVFGISVTSVDLVVFGRQAYRYIREWHEYNN